MWSQFNCPLLGLQGDVGAVVSAVDPDFGDARVCAFASLSEVVANCCDGQNPTARSHQTVVHIEGSATVDDVDAFDGVGIVNALDAVACARCCGCLLYTSDAADDLTRVDLG